LCFRFDHSYDGTREDKTIFITLAGQRELDSNEDTTILIMVAKLRGFDANVASESKWVLDIHQTDPFSLDVKPICL
jgi:hypothetical protein